MASNCFVNPQGETDTYEETRLCRRKQKQLFCGLIIQTELERLGLLDPYNEETTLLGVGIGKCAQCIKTNGASPSIILTQKSTNDAP